MSEPQEETPIEPDRPIIDPHLHLWDIRALPGAPQLPHRFLFHEAMDTLQESGHNVTHSVYVEAHAMYREGGPDALKPVGETEFANGCAAMGASGQYGPRRIAHRIVGSANLLLGDAVTPVLEAHMAAAGERFRGIRFGTAFSEAGLFGWPCDPRLREVMREPGFRAGARALAKLDLSLDVWCLHTQLAQVVELADALPDLTIVLNHLGTPERRGDYAGREADARREWQAQIEELARRPNTLVKLGGLGMDLAKPVGSDAGAASSAELARQWRPWLEACIAAFGPQRSMFESNFPPDAASGSYGATWNAFKRLAGSFSAAEKDSLFRGTAARTYRIAIE